jgi:cystathionine beta-lyase
LNVERLPIQGEELIQFLAKHGHLDVNNGIKFGSTGKGFIRMNISCPKHIIISAMDNLKHAVDLINVQKSEQNC